MEEPPNIKDTALTADTARWLFAGIAAAGIAGASLLVWVDSRVVDGVRNYANEYIYPRVTENERQVTALKNMIESSDQSRNRQYGEMKSNQEAILKQLKGHK